MKKFTSILLFALTISVLSCGSETNSKKSSSQVKKDLPKNDSSPEKVIASEETKAESESPSPIKKSSGHSDDDDDDVLYSTPEFESPDLSVHTNPIPNETIQVVETYNFHSYDQLNTLLKKYVSGSGNVNYSGIKVDGNALNAILKEFKDNYPESSWSSNQKLAYWINAYNIFTIKLIVDNYPTTSITKITAEPWKKKFIELGGKTLSLNHIENEIIRKEFSEPRIHFALNCASKSCPVLLNAAYTSNNIQSKLTSQTKRFLNDSTKNKFDKKEIYISKIFDWYKEDFTKNGTVIDFINKYRTEQLSSPKISYAEYSWDLNN